MMDQIKILMLEDYSSDAELIQLELKEAGLNFTAKRIEAQEEFIKSLVEYSPDIILADYKLPQWTAIDALLYLKERKYNLPFILVTGTQTEEVAVESMKQGADDYILKDSLKRLPSAIQNALRNKEVEKAKAKAEEAFRAEYNFRKSIEDSMLAGVISIDSSFRITYVNSSFCKMVGRSKKELIGGTPPFIYWPPEKHDELLRKLNSYKNPDIFSFIHETQFSKKGNGLFDVQVMTSAMVNGNGETTGWVAVVHDITEQKRKEKQIKASLKEKEILLKEIHHRVKNNLQIISSLLNLQSGYLTDKRALEVFNDSKNRVKAMALIHEKLYKSEELSQINFSSYVEDLVRNLCSSYNLDSNDIEFSSDIEEINFDIDTSMSLGIIMSELVSNSLKHAFNKNMNKKNKIDVSLKYTGDKVKLSESDNGVGIKKEIDINNTDSLGLQLVRTLVDQLDGEIDIKRTGGTEVTIEFYYPRNGKNF